MKQLITRSIIAIILAVTLWTVAPQPAQAQTYCNPYNYSYMCYIYYLNFYNASRSINYWNYSYGYNYYPSNYTTSGFQNYQWSPGDRFYFYIYAQGSYRYNMNVRIWVDWNNNGSFNDAGDKVFDNGYASYYISLSSSWVIPANAPGGQHRMRVMCGYYYYIYYYADPCGSYWYWENEDYNINIALKNDAGITAITSPVDKFDSYQGQDVTVTLKNFSDIQLTSCTLNWSVDGVTMGSYNWSGALNKNQTENVTIATGQMFTPYSPWNPFRFEAWTSNPQGVDPTANAYPDGNAGNDRFTANISCILNDAGFLNADAMLPIDFGVNDVKLTIKNFARKPLDRVTINWKVDGIVQTPFLATFSPPLNENETAVVTVGTYFFGAGNQAYLIEASTSNPNGVADEVPGNDGGSSEVYKALQGGTYTIGATQSDFVDIQEVAEFIGFWGIAGPVTFLVRQGEYYGSFVFQPKGGRQFPMTFESITRRPLDVVIYNDGRDNNNYIFRLDGYDNIIFRSLTFVARNSGYPNMIEFLNGNTDILFENCVFNGIQYKGYIFNANGPIDNLELSKNIFNYSYRVFMNNGTPVVNSWIHDNEFNNFSGGGFIVDFFYIGNNNIQVENNILNADRSQFGIILVGSNMSFSNNRLNGFESYGYGGPILIAEEGGTNIINDNTISATNTFGIYGYNSTNGVEIKNNTISITGDGNPYIAGMYLNGPNYNVSGNSINVQNANGIYAENGDNVRISYNNVDAKATSKNTLAGLFFNGTNYGLIADNEVSASGMAGILQSNTSYFQVMYNTSVTSDNWPAFAFNPFSGGYLAEAPAIPNNNNSEAVTINYGNSPVRKNDKNKELAIKQSGNNELMRNIFQSNGGGYAGYIVNNSNALQSDANNWWTNGGNLFDYNSTLYPTLADYQTASGLDLTSSSVEAKFLSPTDLRLTDVNDKLYYTQKMFFDNRYDEYEKFDLGGVERTKTYYKGAHSIVPTITMAEEPKDVVDCYGTINHSFIVIANVDYNATLTYQWYKDNVEIFGATGPILYVNEPMDFEMDAVYQCKVMANGEAEPIWTRPALLYTMRPTEITRQPDNVRNNLGDVSVFEIDMHIYKEVPALYQPDIQWYRGGQMLVDNDKIAGTKSSIMTIRDLQPEDYGNDYYVIISGLCGADTSANISLTEIPKLRVEDLAGTMTICAGEDVSWTVNATSNVQGLIMTYKWLKDGAELTDGGRIAGAKTANLVIMGATAADAGSYMCKITLEGWDAAFTNASVLTVNTAPVIKTDLEASIAVQTGRDLVLTVAAEGAGLSYQWYFNGAEITGETSATLTKTNVQTTDEGIYKVKVYNICGEVYSAECTVTITPYILLGKDDAQAGEYILNQNSPNPFAGATIIGFILPDASHAKLAITDVYGRELAVIADKSMPAGLSQFTVNSNELNLTSGVYFYTLTVSGKSITKTMVIVK